MIDFDGGASHRSTPLTCDHVLAVLRRVTGTHVVVDAVELATTWTDRAFLAASYRQGRVLLAGDAAHVHAPLGGQGLNLGIGDAMNLGWKLAAVIHGEGPSSLLDSYGQERRPVAEQVLDWSRAQVALLRPDAGAAALRNVVRDLMDTCDGSTYFAGRVWGVGLRYAPLAATHPLIGRSAPDIMLADGRRLNEALRSGRPLLVDFDPADPLAEIAGAFPRLDYAIAGSRFDPGLAALLVRPDGIVAWAGSTSDHAAVGGAVARLLDPQLVA